MNYSMQAKIMNKIRDIAYGIEDVLLDSKQYRFEEFYYTLTDLNIDISIFDHSTDNDGPPTKRKTGVHIQLECS